jgi:hypothetical protein
MRPSESAEVRPGQTRDRRIIASAAYGWNVLDDAVRQSWNTQGSPRSINEYNLFMTENITLLKNGEPINLTRGTGLIAPEVTAVSETKGGIILTYKAAAEALYLSVYLQDEKHQNKFVTVITNTESAHTVITGLTSDTEVTVYCVFCDTPMAQSVRISASQAIRVTVK